MFEVLRTGTPGEVNVVRGITRPEFSHVGRERARIRLLMGSPPASREGLSAGMVRTTCLAPDEDGKSCWVVPVQRRHCLMRCDMLGGNVKSSRFMRDIW